VHFSDLISVALSRVVSTSFVDKDLYFGSILPAIVKKIILENCSVLIFDILLLLRNKLTKSMYDLANLQRQVKFLLSDLARQEESEPPATYEQAEECKCKERALLIILHL